MHIVIIGNGITGITCARNIRKIDAQAEITVISAESEHFFSRTALMYIYMGHMKYEHTKPYEDWFWAKNRINLLHTKVSYIGAEFKAVVMDDGRMVHYSKLVIATGSVYNRFNWPGQELRGVQGLYSKQDVELMEENTLGVTQAVVVGGGLIGIEMAEMLRSRNIDVTFLVREAGYWGNVLPKEESELVGRHIREHHIDLRLNTGLKELLADDNGRVRAVVTTSGEEIPCQFAGLTAGVSPNLGCLGNSGIETGRGVLVNEYLETNIRDVYAAGDCAEFRNPKENHPAVEQLWYTGKLQGEALARIICGKRLPYNRGVWFNSAKFMDIEYQTYGLVFPTLIAGERSFYWEHPQGRISFRVNYREDDGAVTGFNFLGMRFRQAVAEDWIRNKKSAEYAIDHLQQGVFDPEFYRRHDAEIKSAFKQPKLSYT